MCCWTYVMKGMVECLEWEALTMYKSARATPVGVSATALPWIPIWTPSISTLVKNLSIALDLVPFPLRFHPTTGPCGSPVAGFIDFLMAPEKFHLMGHREVLDKDWAKADLRLKIFSKSRQESTHKTIFKTQTKRRFARLVRRILHVLINSTTNVTDPG